ncbi:MAG: glycosyltransferase family 1 protein, partial [Sphingobium limneticum]
MLLSVSNSAKQEAVDLAKVADERIAVIGSAAAEHFVDPRISPVERQKLLDRYHIERPFVMHISAYEARKNFEGLVMAFGALPMALRERHQLVLVCKLDEQDRYRLEAAIGEAGLTQQDVVLTGYIPDDVLPALYAACRLFVFPSFHEGFGLPVLEAMQCGTPVIGANVSSIPEVIGWDEALFDPASTADMACLLEKALGDDNFYSRLREHALAQAKRFTWDGVARRAIAAIEHARAIRPASVPLAEVLRAQESERLLPLIARVHAETPPSRADLLAVAVALARNEASARPVRQQARAGKAISWRIEGPFDSHYSLALVNRETARALASLGHAPQLYSTEGGGDFVPDPTFLARHRDLSRMHEAASAKGHNPLAITSRNLFPPRVDDFAGPGLRALHGYAWEETGFPAEWVADFNAHLDLVLVTSRHVEKLLIDNGVRTPI